MCMNILRAAFYLLHHHSRFYFLALLVAFKLAFAKIATEHPKKKPTHTTLHLAKKVPLENKITVQIQPKIAMRKLQVNRPPQFCSYTNIHEKRTKKIAQSFRHDGNFAIAFPFLDSTSLIFRPNVFLKVEKYTME